MEKEKIIREVQKRQLQMLKIFGSICKKYDLAYWCAFGTLLGAIRHNGFVPWDDDIDVAMLRDDFEKLCRVPREEWGEEYLFLTPAASDPRHDKFFGRVYLKDSRIQSYHDIHGSRNWEDNKPWSTSMMMDIFVFDYLPDNEEERDSIYNQIFYKYRPAYLISKVKPYTDQQGFLPKMKMYLKQCRGRILRTVLREPWKYYYDKYLKLVAGSHKGTTLIGCYATTGYYTSAFNSDENIWYYRYDDIYPLTTVQFEGMEIPAPKEWDKLLHLWYDNKDGDYMTLPPEDKRYHIDFIYMDFGDGTKIVLDPVKGSLGENEESTGI